MVTSLAQILERKRQEAQTSSNNMLQTITQGQLQGTDTANKLTQVKRDEEARKAAEDAKKFNPVNALVSGGTAFVASGGNPVAAGLAALGSARGKTKPLEAVVSGGSAGITQGKTSISDLAKPENIDQLVLASKQAGAPKSVVSGLETYAKGQAVKAKAAATKSKLETDAKTKLELEKRKSLEKTESEKEKRLSTEKIASEKIKSAEKLAGTKSAATVATATAKKDAADRLAEAKVVAAGVKSNVENRRLAMKEFNIQLSEITGKGKGSKEDQRRKFQENKEKFIENYIKDLKVSELDPMGIL